MKERDGFCRRIDGYDGQVIAVDGQIATYEIGNYLGGGVAGVVYEGHRLRPMEEYPVRTGVPEEQQVVGRSPKESSNNNNESSSEQVGDGFFCGDNACGAVDTNEPVIDMDGSTKMMMNNDGSTTTTTDNTASGTNALIQQLLTAGEEDVAIEATVSYDEEGGVMLDAQDAPSRSKHYTKAAAVPMRARTKGKQPLNKGLPDESVAIKILNPVGYRILPPEGLKDCVVVKKGEVMDTDVRKGVAPMQEKHVWWLVNPNSRNLRTLQRYNGKDENSTAPKGLQIDRGSAKKGLRLSLIAAYVDPRSDNLRELTLTRCIEIWGHVPFNATDTEFEDMLTAIERVNAGHPPPAFPVFDNNNNNDDVVPGRVGTDKTDRTNDSSASENNNSNEGGGGGMSPVAFGKART
ncbi:MAG: hypothetical protein SGARI_004357 [Bacillariaceae sp.]